MLEKHILEHQKIKQRTISESTFVQSTKKENTWIKHILVLSMVGVLLLFGVVQVFKLSFFQLRNVRITGVRTVDTSQVEQVLQEYLGKTHVTGIKRGNLLFLRTNQLSNHLLDKYASFKHVRTEFTEPGVLTVYVDEYSPAYVWCNTECLFADDTGYLYRYTFDRSGGFIVFRGGLAKDGFELRNNIFVGDYELNFFNELRLILYKHNIILSEVAGVNNADIIAIIKNIGEYQLKNKVELRMSRKTSLEYVNTMLTLILDDQVFKNRLQTGNTLDYIDLRYPEKIFYKFNNSPQQVVVN